ncbi:hypothetical protein Tco_0835162 [Tanacetum coccineum]
MDVVDELGSNILAFKIISRGVTNSFNVKDPKLRQTNRMIAEQPYQACRPPKKYEDSVCTLSKCNGIKEESRNDEISKDDSMNKEASSIEVNMGGNDETGEFNECLKEIRGREVEKNNEKVNNSKKLANSDESANQERIKSSENTEITKANGSDENGGKTKSYANMVKSNEMLVNKNLIYIALKVTEDGMVKVLLDEEIVSKGCAK